MGLIWGFVESVGLFMFESIDTMILPQRLQSFNEDF